MGGTVCGEHGIGIGKQGHMAGEHGEALEFMGRIKSAFDPGNI